MTVSHTCSRCALQCNQTGISCCLNDFVVVHGDVAHVLPIGRRVECSQISSPVLPSSPCMTLPGLINKQCRYRPAGLGSPLHIQTTQGSVAYFLVDLIKQAVDAHSNYADASASHLGWDRAAGIGQGTNGQVFGVACHRQSFRSGRFRALTRATTPRYYRQFQTGLRHGAVMTLSTPF